MTKYPGPACPCCGDLNPESLGSLPDSDHFAGKILPASLPGGNLYRCPSCHMKFRYPIQDTETYDKMYDNGGASHWSGDLPRHDWDQIVYYLENASSRRRAVLDYGCNTGGLLARLGPDFRRFGIEINWAAAAIASKQHSIHVWSTIDEIPTGLLFDVIVVADVIEHVRNPRELIDQLTELLSARGRLVVTTGDAENVWWNRFGANWWYCFNSEHIAFISKSWLDCLVQRRELKVVECKRFRYRRLGVFQRCVHAFFMVLYGIFPKLYLRVGNALKMLLSGSNLSRVLGNGVSADHLLIVLTRNNEQ